MPYILKVGVASLNNSQGEAAQDDDIRFMASEQAKEYCFAAHKRHEYVGVYFVENDDDSFDQLKSLLADAQASGCFHRTIEAVKRWTPDVWQRFESQQQEAPEDDCDPSKLPDISAL